MKKIISTVLALAFSAGAGQLTLRNGDSYNGCEDTYLSALFGNSALTEMVSDSQTNFSSKPNLSLTH